MHPLYLLTTLLTTLPLCLTLNTSEPIDQLFLPFTIDQVLKNNTDGLAFYEPWATEYVRAITDSRFGDAVWARYHLSGAHDEIIDATGYTVLEEIEDDAEGYRMEDPDGYQEALSSVYEQTSAEDGHGDVIDILVRVGEQDLTELGGQDQAGDWEMFAESFADDAGDGLGVVAEELEG